MDKLSFIINGNVPSKKNSKRIVGNGKRKFIISSVDYIAWENWAIKSLVVQRAEKKGVSFPISSTVTVLLLFRSRNKRSFDLTNKAEGVMDALVRAGILLDDNRKIVKEITIVDISDTCISPEDGVDISIYEKKECNLEAF